jgi:putative endonuclease
MKFSYVYLLVSESDQGRHYAGLTYGLKERIRRHNAGEVPRTAKFRPWRVNVAAFEDRAKAAEFGKYPRATPAGLSQRGASDGPLMAPLAWYPQLALELH